MSVRRVTPIRYRHISVVLGKTAEFGNSPKNGVFVTILIKYSNIKFDWKKEIVIL